MLRRCIFSFVSVHSFLTCILTDMWWAILSVGGLVVVAFIRHTCGGAEALISTDSDRGALGVRCSPVVLAQGHEARQGPHSRVPLAWQNQHGARPPYSALLMDFFTSCHSDVEHYDNCVLAGLFLLPSWWRKKCVNTDINMDSICYK